jgi:hypothetical protein
MKRLQLAFTLLVAAVLVYAFIMGLAYPRGPLYPLFQ